jgi:hypothetical protein
MEHELGTADKEEVQEDMLMTQTQAAPAFEPDVPFDGVVDKVAIVGFSPSTRNLAPFNDPSFEMWGMNSLFQFLPGPWHRWIELHGQKHLNEIHKESWPKIQNFFKTCNIPIYMQDHYEEYPTSVKYPLEEINAMFQWDDVKPGLDYYYESTVAYLIALALYENTIREVPFKEIHLYGIDMVHETEWGFQRPNTEFFIGWAMGKGVKFHMPKDCALMSPLWLYAYEEKPFDVGEAMSEGIGKREKELDAILAKKEEEHMNALCQKVGYECALQELNHLRGFLTQVRRGRQK